MASTTCYLHLEPVWSPYYKDDDGDPALASIRVARMTKSRPSKPRMPVVKLTLKIPDGAFKPLKPTVVIDIPEAALDFEPAITVELPDQEEEPT